MAIAKYDIDAILKVAASHDAAKYSDMEYTKILSDDLSEVIAHALVVRNDNALVNTLEEVAARAIAWRKSLLSGNSRHHLRAV